MDRKEYMARLDKAYLDYGRGLVSFEGLVEILEELNQTWRTAHVA